MAKRILSIAMALILMMNVFVVAVSAAGEADYHGAFKLSAKLSSDGTIPKRGDTVTVTLSAQTDYPVAIMSAIVVYDHDYYDIVGTNGTDAFTMAYPSSWPVSFTGVISSPSDQYHPSYTAEMKAKYKLAFVSLILNSSLNSSFKTPTLSTVTDLVSFQLKVRDTAPEDGKGIIWVDPVYGRSTSYAAKNTTKLSRGGVTISQPIQGYGQTIDYSEAKLFEPGETPDIDYSALQTLVTEATAINENIALYTEATATPFASKLADAKAMVANQSAATQADVDTMKADLQTAMDGLKKLANYTSVNDAIGSKPADFPGAYTTESVAAVNAAIDAVDWQLDETQQGTVTGYATAITSAINALEKIANPIDYTTLSTLVTEANAINENIVLYTKATATPFASKLVDAKAMVANQSAATQADVDNMKADLETAMNGLKKLANYTSVNDAIGSKPADFPDAYTTESVAAVNAAIDAVDWQLDDTQQETVTGYATAITSAINALEKIANPINYTILSTLVTEANAINENIALYTKATATPFASKLADAKEMIANQSAATQADVDNMKADLQTAMDGLKKLANYTSVSDAINSEPNDYPDAYTAESVAAVIAAIDAVDWQLDETQQATVDGYATAITNAIQSLVLKEHQKAIYTAVYDALQRRPKDNSVYEQAGIVTMNAAIEDVDYDLYIEDQAKVDAYAVAINTAIDNLVLIPDKLANYTGLNSLIEISYPRDDMLATGIYNADQIAALETLKDSFYTYYGTGNQSVVDGYVTELKAAIAALTVDESKAVASFDLDTDVAYAREGSSVKVSVKLKTNYPIYTMMVPVIYDKTVFEMKDVSSTNASAFLTFGGQLADAMDTSGNCNQLTITNVLSKGNTNTAYWYSTEAQAKYGVAFVTWSANSKKSSVCVKLNEYETIVSFSMKVKPNVPEGTVSQILMSSDFLKTSTFSGGKLAIARGVGDLLSSLATAHVDVGQTVDLSKATVSVTLNPSTAVYDALNTLIAHGDTINTALYTDETVTPFAAKLAEAKKFVAEPALPADQQATVDAMTAALLATIDALVKKDANYEALTDLITGADKINTALYTETTVSLFTAKLAEAKAFAAATPVKIDEQNKVDNMTAALQSKINDLVKKDANYTALTDLITYADGINTALYTEATVTPFTAKLAEAKAFATATPVKIDEQGTVDAMKEALQNEINDLVYKDADYKVVDDAIANIPADLSIYTDASAKVVTDAKDAVKYGLDITHQDEVNAMADAINNAVAALEKLANYSAVEAAIVNIPADLTIYTDASAKAVTDAKDAVKYRLGVSQQDTVNGYAATINAAVQALVKKDANYEALNTLIADADKINTALYTEATVSPFTAKLAEAKAFAAATPVKIDEQSIVEAMTAALQKTIKDLVYKDADYKIVDDAIANIPADLSIYTDASAKVVTDAKDAVKYGLDITKQTIVDGYATTINVAVKALVVKDADYTAVNTAITRANTFDLSKYTNETAQAVRNAIAAVVTGLKITEQARVDDMAKVINDAVNALVPNTEIWSEWIVVTQPTCTEQGIERRTSNLGNTEDRAVAAVGHNWSEWVSNGDAGFFVNGTETRTCSVCGATETRVDQGSAGYFDFVDGNSNWFLNVVVYVVRIVVVITTGIFKGIQWYI